MFCQDKNIIEEIPWIKKCFIGSNLGYNREWRNKGRCE